MTNSSELDLTEKTLEQTRIHDGKIIRMRVDKALQPDGKTCIREVVEHPGGVVILPILEDGRLVFVEQWRYPLGQLLLEFPAGKLDPGESKDPMKAAQRELLEETGYNAKNWEPLTHVFTAPGFCDEKLWLYRATDLTLADYHQTDDDEFINLKILTLAEALEKVKRQEIVDAKTLCLLLFCVQAGITL